MSMEKFADLYRASGFEVTVTDQNIELTLDDMKFRAPINDEWRANIASFYKAKQYIFSEERRLLTSYKTIETELVRIDPSFSGRPDHEYSDNKGNNVKISAASPEFVISFMGAKNEPNPMRSIKRRLMNRTRSRKPGKDGFLALYGIDDILFTPMTAEYSVPKKISDNLLLDRGLKSIKSSLFKLALNNGECWELREAMPISARSSTPVKPEEPDTAIPKAIYNDDLVKFYKVARSSVFPSQQFLSFYHVLEYNFLRVADEILHTSIKSMINSPTFNASYHNVNKLISTLKKNDNSSDETEMLKAVLKKYLDEDDLIEHIQNLEKNAGKNIYTDTKKRIFGDVAFIKLEKGHALQNTAKVIKQVRNALVHSSDKFNREDCFLPLSESETTVTEYIPILRFLAEKVIFATSDN